MKVCRICGNKKEYNEFHKKKDTKDGFRNECKECIKNVMKKYKDDPNYKENKKEYDKKYYNLNKIKILENKKHYHIKNRDTINENKRIYRLNPINKTKTKLWMKEYIKNNKDVFYRYRKNNPHYIAWRTILHSTLKRFALV